MKKIVLEFIRRGLVSMGLGPLILAVVFIVLRNQNLIDTLTVEQVCIGIFSLSLLAFVAGGMNVIYQIERIPLITAILIHGCVLYVGYLATYLINGWLNQGIQPIIVFTAVFLVGYIIIWGSIYSAIRLKTKKINERLRHSQNQPDDML